MGFWKNVDDYLKYKDISRKELAAGIGMKSQTIDRAIQRDSEPKFSEGLKVCRFLHTSIDEFLDNPISLPNEITEKSESEIKKEIHLYRKYYNLIQDCENLSPQMLLAVSQLAQTLSSPTSVPSSEPYDLKKVL